MAQEWAVKFYASQAWQDCRHAYIVSVYGLCERCQQPGVIVHHRIKLTPSNINDPNITLNHEHLELLCVECHNTEHMGKHESVTQEGLRFTINGDLTEVV
jgi:hypothetical protein